MIETQDNGMPSGAPPSSSALAPASRGKLISVTLRLDPARYERLKLYGLKRRMTNQQVLIQALDLILSAA